MSRIDVYYVANNDVHSSSSEKNFVYKLDETLIQT